MNPLDYSLCSQTVTIYRKRADEILRQVAENCHLASKTVRNTENLGKSMAKKFLLIIPGEADLQPGDRVYEGIGPEEVQWETFLPVRVAQLYEVSYVKPCYWEGEIAHWEAGHKKEAV